MSQQTQISAATPQLLARNSIYNLATQIALMVVGFLTIPAILRGLSEERFGLLSLVWAVLGSLSLLDFGISRATTKFLADSIARNASSEINHIFWTSFTITIGIGIAISIGLWLATPGLVSFVFSIDPAIRDEAYTSFYLTTLALPFVLLGGLIRGAQMSVQRFDLINVFQAALGLTQWLGAVMLVELGYGLTAIMILTAASRVLVTCASFATMPKIIPNVFQRIILWDRCTFKKLFAFGGWVAVSQILTPLIIYVDRMIIGALVSLAAVAYYSVPQELVSRLLVIPFSLSPVLFPVFSQSSGNAEDVLGHARLYLRSLKYLILGLFPLTLIVFAFATEFLQWWVGNEFAVKAAPILKILSVGFLFNALASMPFAALQAYGRADITAKFHLLEILPTIVLTMVLTFTSGAAGAALAWSLRVMADCILLFMAAKRLIFRVQIGSALLFAQPRFLFQAASIIFLIITISILAEGGIKMALVSIVVVAYGGTIWFLNFDEVDRIFFSQLRAKFFQNLPKINRV